MKTALITGITGQDGAYLAEFLLKKGLVLHEPLLTADKVESFINSLQDKKPSLELMDKGKEAYQLFKREILKFKK